MNEHLSPAEPGGSVGTDPSSASGLPLAAGPWLLDASHAGLDFKVRHLGLSNVHGRFNRFDATLTVGETLADTVIEAAIDMSSVDTNHAVRDTHLLGTDFFSAEEHPLTTFRSTEVRITSEGEYAVTGELTLNGVSRPVTLEVEFNGVESLALDGSIHAGFSAITTVNRDDFGIDFNMPLGMDKVAIGSKVIVEIELQFVAPKA
jgi:polyisoprenoid-binding protein YceI